MKDQVSQELSFDSNGNPLPETAEILTNRTEGAEIIVTLAQNGSLQIKYRV